jgi:hypothetical protein
MKGYVGELRLAWDDGTYQSATVDSVRRCSGGFEFLLRGNAAREDDASRTTTWSSDASSSFAALDTTRAMRFLVPIVIAFDAEHEHGIRGFMRSGAGAFRIEPSAEYQVEIRMPADAPRVYVAVAWRGIPGDRETGEQLQPGRSTTIHWRAPAEGVSLWWSRADEGVTDSILPDPTRGGSIELAPGESSIAIPPR